MQSGMAGRTSSFQEGKEKVEFGMSGSQEEGQGGPSLAIPNNISNSYAHSCFGWARLMSGPKNQELHMELLLCSSLLLFAYRQNHNKYYQSTKSPPYKKRESLPLDAES